MTGPEDTRRQALAEALRAWARDVDAEPYASGLDVDSLLDRWYDSRREQPAAGPVLAVTTTAAATVVAVGGGLDLGGTGRLGRVLAEETGLGPETLLVDLAGVRHCSAAGLSVLLTAAAEADRAEVPFALVGCPPVVRRMLALLRLEAVLPCHRTVGDALAWFTFLAGRTGTAS